MADPQLDFLNTHAGLAHQVSGDLGVDPNALLAQWGLETGWGKSVIPGTNNLGNIKDPTGKGKRAYDKEEGSNDAYMSYASPEDFGKGYADFLRKNPRYKNALAAGTDGNAYFDELQKAGYATDKNYSKKLKKIYAELTGGTMTDTPSTDTGGMMLVNVEGMEMNVPSDATPDEIDELYQAQKKQKTSYKEDTRSLGQKAKDMTLNTVASGANLLSAGASLINPDSAFAKDMSGFAKDIKQEQITEWAQEFNKTMETNIREAKAKGDWGAVAWLEAAAKNPTDLIGAEALGSLIPMAAVGKVAKAVAGTGAALGISAGAGAGLSAGEVRKTFYDGVMSSNATELARTSDKFRDYLDQNNGDVLKAKVQFAKEIDEKLATGMTLAAAIGYATGRTGAEKLIAGGGSSLGAKAVGKEIVKEIAGNAVEEGTTALGGNISKLSINPNQSLMDDVGLSAVQGGVIGGPTAVAAAVIGRDPKLVPKDDGKQPDADQIKQLIDQQKQTGGADKAAEMVTIPVPGHPGVEVTVSKDSQIYKYYESQLPNAGKQGTLDLVVPGDAGGQFSAINPNPAQMNLFDAQQQNDAGKQANAAPQQLGPDRLPDAPTNPAPQYSQQGALDIDGTNNKMVEGQYGPMDASPAQQDLFQAPKLDSGLQGTQQLLPQGQTQPIGPNQVPPGPSPAGPAPGPTQQMGLDIDNSPNPMVGGKFAQVNPSPAQGDLFEVQGNGLEGKQQLSQQKRANPIGPDRLPPPPNNKLAAPAVSAITGAMTIDEKALMHSLEGKGVIDIFMGLAQQSGVPRGMAILYSRIGMILEVLKNSGVIYSPNFLTTEQMIKQGLDHPEAPGNAPSGMLIFDPKANDFRFVIGKTKLDRSIPLLELIAHEGIHGVTHYLIKAAKDPAFAKNPNNLMLMKAIDALNKAYFHTMRTVGNKLSADEKKFFLKNTDEFLAYGLTHPKFIDVLTSIPYQNSNLFMHAIEKILSIFGIGPKDKNMHGELINILFAISKYNTQQVSDSAMASKYIAGQAAPLNASAVYNKTLSLQEGSFGVINNREQLDKAMEGYTRDVQDATGGTGRAARLVRPGLRHLQVVSNHPLIKFANTLIDDALSTAQHVIKQHVLDTGKGKNTVAQLLMGMPTAHRETVHAILKRGDELQMQVDPSKIPGLTDNQKALILKHYEVDTLIYDKGQAARKAVGLPGFADRKGHVPGRFKGRNRALVQDASGRVIGFIGEDVFSTFQEAMKWAKKNHPGAKVTEITGAGRHATNLSTISELLSTVPGISEELRNAARLMDDAMFNMDKHAKDKAGIWGNEGNRPWAEDARNSKDFYQDLMQYYEEAFQHHALQVPLQEIRSANERYASQTPNAVFEIEEYIKTISGHTLNALGAGINAAVDVMMTLPALNKFRGSAVADRVREMMTLSALGFFNTQYVLAQLMQPFMTAAPFAVSIMNKHGITPLAVSRAFVSSALYGVHETIDAMAGLLGMRFNLINPNSAMGQAIQFMEEQGISGTMSVEHKNVIDMGRTYAKAKSIGEWNIKVAEKLTRGPVFMAFFNMIKESPEGSKLPIKDVLEITKNLTQYTMVDYNSWQRPQLYANLGLAGSFLGTFRTFQHANIGQMRALAAGDAKSKRGLLVMAAMLFVMAGAGGFPGVEEADIFTKMLRKASASLGGPSDFRSPREFILDQGGTVAVGAMSQWAGVDLSSKYSVNRIVPKPEESMAQVAMMMDLLDAGLTASGELARTSTLSTPTMHQLAKSILPNSFRNIYDQKVVQQNNQIMDKKGGVKDLVGDDEKTPWVWAHQGKDVNVSLRSKKDWENMSRNKSDQEVMKQASEDFSRLLVSDQLNETNVARITMRYIEKGGDPQVLVRTAVAAKLGSKTETVLRGIAKGKPTLQKIRSLDNPYRQNRVIAE